MKIRAFLTLTVFVFFSAVYLLTTNQIFSFDAVTNAIACESGELAPLFHSNHLFYPLIGALYFKFEKACGYAGYSIYSLARLNSLMMAMGLGLLFMALSGWVGKLRSLLFVVFLGFTFAFWHYAVDGRAIGASVFFSVLVILKLLSISYRGVVRWSDVIGLLFISSLYIFIHGISIFHVFGVAYFLLGSQHLEKRKMAGGYLLGIFLILGVMYVGVFLLLQDARSIDSFFTWVVGYAAFNPNNTGIFSSKFWVSGASTAAVGFVSGWAQAFLHSNHHVQKVLSISFSGLILILIWLIYLRTQKIHHLKLLATALMIWGVGASIFLVFWSPGQEGFRLIVMLPWLCVFVLLAPRKSWFNWFIGGGASILFVNNFITTIYPSAFIENNVGFQALGQIQALTRPNDIFISLYGRTTPGIEVLRPYFFPKIRGGTINGRLYAFGEQSLDPLYLRLCEIQNTGAHIYFDEDLFDTSMDQALEESRGLEPGSVAQFRKKFEILNEIKLEAGGKIFRVAISSLPKTIPPAPEA